MPVAARPRALLTTVAAATVLIGMGSATDAQAAPDDAGPANTLPARTGQPFHILPARVPAHHHLSTAAVARYKAAHDTIVRVRLSASAQQAVDLRTEQALRYYSTKNDVARHAGDIAPAATARTLAATQQAQRTSYWCGPAAVSAALAARNVHISQSRAARLLRTTVDGTAWSGVRARVPGGFRTGYPVADVLTYALHRQGAAYHPAWVAYNPTRRQQTAYRARLVADIDNGWDLVGNAWEVPGGPHLVGHPGNQEIFHFYTVRGYTRSGAVTRYQDSVHGASSISWSSHVPAYASISSSVLTVINGGRGYVW